MSSSTVFVCLCKGIGIINVKITGDMNACMLHRVMQGATNCVTFHGLESSTTN